VTRRRRSFGPDSPEVVTIGEPSQLGQSISEAHVELKTKSDLIGKPSLLQCRRLLNVEPTDVLSCGKLAIGLSLWVLRVDAYMLYQPTRRIIRRAMEVPEAGGQGGDSRIQIYNTFSDRLEWVAKIWKRSVVAN
jgi:hypothetical protein